MAAKNEAAQTAAKEKEKKDAKTADGITKRYVLQAIRRLEKENAAGKQFTEEGKEATDERVQAVLREAAKLAKFNTLVTVVSKLPDVSGSVYPNWLIKVQCQGLDGDPMKKFFAVFRSSESHKLTIAAKLKGGMRLRLQVEPFDAQPESVRQLPIADDFNNFDLPVYWVTSFDHDEPLLRQESLPPVVELFGQIPPGFVFKSPIEVPVGSVKMPFYFFGGDWANYRPWATAQLLGNHPGFVRHSIMAFHQALKRRGIRLVFAPVPISATIFSDLALGKDEGVSLVGPPANGGVADLLTALRQDGVEVLDLTEALRRQRYIEHGGGRYPVCQPNGRHLAAPGCMVIASEMAKAAQGASARLDNSSNLFKIESKIVQHPGDLQEIPMLKFLGIEPPMAPMLIPQVLPLTDEARKMLNADVPKSIVHIIGDSQCGIYQDYSANIQAHLVRDLGQSVNLAAIPGSAHHSAVDGWLRSEGLTHAKIVFWLVSELYLSTPGWIDVSNHPALTSPDPPLLEK